jgi:hypothetical protein
MSFQPLLTSLVKQLEIGLAFRKQQIVTLVRPVIDDAVKAGALGSDRMVVAMATAYEAEAKERTDLIVKGIRQARSSWSPRQLVEARERLKGEISDLLTRDLQYAARLTCQVGGLIDQIGVTKNEAGLATFMRSIEHVSQNSVAMVNAVIDEVAAAAENEMTATTSADRPSYVIQNTFNASVNAVAQGHAAITNATQTISSATPAELAETVATILRALSTMQGPSAETLNATSELRGAETELSKGKVPLGRLLSSLGVIRKIEEVAIHAPDALGHIQTLMSQLGLG